MLSNGRKKTDNLSLACSFKNAKTATITAGEIVWFNKTVLRRISVHFGATQRTQGVKLHVRDTDKTQGDRGARVDLKDESRPTSQQLHSSHRDKKNIKFIWHKTPASTANTKIEKTTGRRLSERLSDRKTSRHCLTERGVNTHSCHTPVQTQVCANSYRMTWSTHVTALCINQITHGGHIYVNVSC